MESRIKMDNSLLADDIAFQTDAKPRTIARGVIAYLDDSPVYQVSCQPTFENPVSVKGLNGKVIGFANLHVSDTKSRVLSAQIFLNHETEERLLLEGGESLWPEIDMEEVSIDSSSNGWSFDRQIVIREFWIEGLRISQRKPLSGRLPLVMETK